MGVISDLVLDENNIAYHPMMGNSYQLNNTANEIITALKRGESKEQIIRVLSGKYTIPESELYIDVSDFLAKLKVYGLI